jgi:choline kinase
MGGERPKTLLPLTGPDGREREPLLYYLLTGLKLAGVTDVLIVTGFAPEQVEEHVQKYGEGLAVTYRRNFRYASWGNFHSVRVALDASPGYDVLVVNSDVVVPPAVYQRVIDTDGDLVLAVQKRDYLSDEDMRVQLRGNRVLAVSKQLHRARSHGEFAGVSLVRPVAARAYVRAASAVEWTGDTHLYYEDIYDRILADLDARAAFVGPTEYAEVDTPADIVNALTVLDTHADNNWA